MLPFRILQIAIKSLLFILSTFSAVDFAADMHGLFDSRDILPLAILVISIASMIALVGSIRLNLQILGGRALQHRPAESLSGQLFLLAFAMALLYIALEWRTFANLTYDSHLSTHYLTIALPDWSWLQAISHGAVTIHNDQILNLILYLIVIVELIMTRKFSVNVNSTDTFRKKVSASLIKYQIASGIIFLLLAGVCLYAFIGRLTAFRTLLEFDPNMMNLSNLAGFGFQLVNAVLLTLYGQWILRDGLRLRIETAQTRLHSQG